MFEKALTGIRGQKYVRSMSAITGSCSYVGPNNTFCAVGHCLTEEQRQQVVEQNRNDSHFSDLYNIEGVYETLNVNDNEEFLSSLQNIHDKMGAKGSFRDQTCGTPELFEQAMKDLAEEYELTYTEPA